MNDGIGVSKIEDSSEFITGDNPVIIRSAQGSLVNIFEKDNVIHLPINKKYLLTIIPKSEDSLQGKFLRISASQDYVVSINYDIVKNSEKWIIGSKDGIHNHLDKVEAIDNDIKGGSEYADRMIEKANVMKDLEIVRQKNGGILNKEVLNKIIDASKLDVMKDDVNMVRYIAELKRDGHIS